MSENDGLLVLFCLLGSCSERKYLDRLTCKAIKDSGNRFRRLVRSRRVLSCAIERVAEESLCDLALSSTILMDESETISLPSWANDCVNSNNDMLFSVIDAFDGGRSNNVKRRRWEGYFVFKSF
jgi:hypothetical protein